MRSSIGLVSLSVLLGLSCAHAPRPPADVAAFHQLLDDYYEEALVQDPVLATSLGDHRYDDRLADDISDEFRAHSADVARRFLDRLAAFDAATLGPDDRLSHQLLRHKLDDRLEALRYPEHLLPFTHISGWPVDFPILGSGNGVHSFNTTADYDHFLRRIGGFQAWIDTAIANMRTGIAAGVVLPKLVVEKLLPQLDAQIVSDPSKSLFFVPLQHPPAAVSATDRARLEAAYRAAIVQKIVPTYQRLKAFLTSEYLPHCRETVAFEALPNGPAWYAYRVRSSTTTRRTPDEIFALGEAEVARLDAEMVRLRDRRGFRGDLHAFARSLSGGASYSKRQDLVNAYVAFKDRVWAGLPRLFGRLPKAPLEIRAVEPFREDSAPSQYQSASPDGSRPGVFYVNAAGIEKTPMRVSETLFLHEALPGHHFQISLQLENGEQPRFRRLLDYIAFVEGWALYAETLGTELGVYEDDAQMLEHLGEEMLRAVRLVVDTGLHHRGWTRARALAFFEAHVVSTASDVGAEARLEVDRYIAWPGQALAYKSGQLALSALRAQGQQSLGARFDLRAFHDRVMEIGPVPLDLLDTLMAEWMAQRRG